MPTENNRIRLSATGDLLRIPPPSPFLERGQATPPSEPGKAEAQLEGEADLAAWVRFALAMLRPKGSVTFIHRADRLEQLLAQFAGRAGEIVVFPLWPGAGKPARRVIVHARKGIASPTRLLPGMVLHGPDGRFTAEAEAVLRHAAALPLDPPREGGG